MVQLQNEHRTNQLKVEQQQNQQQHTLLAQTRKESTCLDNIRNSSDEEAPQVPARKSSRANVFRKPTSDGQLGQSRLPQNIKLMNQPASTKRNFDISKLPKPLLYNERINYDDYDDYDDEVEWAPPPPVTRHSRDMQDLISLVKRPSQPPPPPPAFLGSNVMPQDEDLGLRKYSTLPYSTKDNLAQSSTSKEVVAPKNIWSPSTSSAEMSGSCNEFVEEESDSLNPNVESDAKILLSHLQRPLLAELSSSSHQTQDNTVIDQDMGRYSQIKAEPANPILSSQVNNNNNNNKNNNNIDCVDENKSDEIAELKNDAQIGLYSDSSNVMLGEVPSTKNEREKLIAQHQKNEVEGIANKSTQHEANTMLGELQHTPIMATTSESANNSDTTSDLAVAEIAPVAKAFQGESSKTAERNKPLLTPMAPPDARAWAGPVSTAGIKLVDTSQAAKANNSKLRSFSIGGSSNVNKNNPKTISDELKNQASVEQREEPHEGDEEEEELRKYWTLPANSSSHQTQIEEDRCLEKNMHQLMKKTRTTRRELRESYTNIMKDERSARQLAAQSLHENLGERGAADFSMSREQSNEYNQLEHACANNTSTNNNNNAREDQYHVQVKNLGLEEKLVKKQEMQHTTRDEWFRHMYKQMHKQSPEKNLFQAINSQPDTTQIRIKLKSPRPDHRSSPSYYSEEDYERKSFKPGNISDYLPGQSSISNHERNLVSDRTLSFTPSNYISAC